MTTVAQHGRIRVADLASGQRYYAIYTPTGRCIYRTLSKDEAGTIVARDSERYELRSHYHRAEVR